jgi:hypothetical protein
VPRSNTKVSLAVLTIAATTLAGVAACGGPEPKMVATKDDGVAASSASEERLSGAPKPKAAEPAADPTQPLTIPMAGEGSAGSAKAGKDPPAARKAGGAVKVSKLECKQLFDKYIDLTIGSDPRFEGLPPELVTQMKESALAQAQSQKGDPCSTQEVSRTQYNCAIASTSTAGWTRCMK